MEELSLHRDGVEDLVDYDDSDIEIEIGDNNSNSKTSAAAAVKELQLKTRSTGTPEPHNTAEEADSKDQSQERVQQHSTDDAPDLSATKTPQAANLIKTLQALLADPAFRKNLGLSAPGDLADLSFWANGCDFAIVLKLTGAAVPKACRHGVKCHNTDCTFVHGGADHTATIAAGKPKKLCSMINTLAACPKGNACWFSHEAE